MDIVLTHSKLGDAEYVPVNEAQAALLERSGWKRKKKSTTTKAASAKTEEK